ncbi:MAG: hypothetical protein ABH870_00570 [bacterium]
MSTTIFISHSVAPSELAIVAVTAEESLRRGATPLVPGRDWDPEEMPQQISDQINSSDYMIAIASQNGGHLSWLNTEINYWQSKGKPFLLVSDAVVQTNPLCERIILNRNNPLSTISEIHKKIEQKIHDNNAREIISGLLIGGVILMVLCSLKEK